jgi:hypothetical protein
MAMAVNQAWSHGIGRTVNAVHLGPMGMLGVVRIDGFED